MRLTESTLRRIIREEIGILLEREYYYRYDVNSKKVYHGDDEGNEVLVNVSPSSIGIYLDGLTDAEIAAMDPSDLIVPTSKPPGGGGSYGYDDGGYGRRRRSYNDDDGWGRGGFYDGGRGGRGRY